MLIAESRWYVLEGIVFFCLNCIFEIFKYKYVTGDCGLRFKSHIKVFHLRTVLRSKDNCGELWAMGLVILQCILF